jgi:secondary thiamine-phosphate synthase enzyme
MRQHSGDVLVQTHGPGLYDITRDAHRFVHDARIADGLLTVFVQHTSASLLIQENADPDVLADLESFMQRVVPRDPKLYCHRTEGPDDMPAHIRSALTATSLSIPVRAGAPVLGTWQGLYLFEHRDRAHQRKVAMHIIGE